jgi:hypothetical protein
VQSANSLALYSANSGAGKKDELVSLSMTTSISYVYNSTEGVENSNSTNAGIAKLPVTLGETAKEGGSKIPDPYPRGYPIDIHPY